NRSSPPSLGVMKPKPLESLNHLTVPVGMSFLPFMCRDDSGRDEAGHDDQGRDLTATDSTRVLRCGCKYAAFESLRLPVYHRAHAQKQRRPSSTRAISPGAGLTSAP